MTLRELGALAIGDEVEQPRTKKRGKVVEITYAIVAVEWADGTVGAFSRREGISRGRERSLRRVESAAVAR